MYVYEPMPHSISFLISVQILGAVGCLGVIYQINQNCLFISFLISV